MYVGGKKSSKVVVPVPVIVTQLTTREYYLEVVILNGPVPGVQVPKAEMT